MEPALVVVFLRFTTEMPIASLIAHKVHLRLRPTLWSFFVGLYGRHDSNLDIEAPNL